MLNTCKRIYSWVIVLRQRTLTLKKKKLTVLWDMMSSEFSLRFVCTHKKTSEIIRIDFTRNERSSCDHMRHVVVDGADVGILGEYDLQGLANATSDINDCLRLWKPAVMLSDLGHESRRWGAHRLVEHIGEPWVSGSTHVIEYIHAMPAGEEIYSSFLNCIFKAVPTVHATQICINVLSGAITTIN